MSDIQFKLIESERGRVLSVLVDGDLEVLDDTHPNFEKVLDAVRSGVTPDANLFSLAKAVATKFDSLSERVSVQGGRVFFDGDEVDNSLTQQIVRFLEANEDFAPLVHFLEKVSTNPDERSREQLYAWLSKRQFTITADGDFIAYKGVNPTTEQEDGKPVYKSSNSGKAIVNGELREGQIPQWVGAVVEMPRSEVVNDPRNGCSVGLHAATFDFAKNWTHGTVLALRINPRDVVSVPDDSSQQKLRVCRYLVDKLIEVEYTDPVYADEYGDDYDEESDDELGWGDGEDGEGDDEWFADDEFYGDESDQPIGTPASMWLGHGTPPTVTTTTGPQVLDVTSTPLNSQAKLNWTLVAGIRKDHANGHSVASLADEYGVSKRAIQRIVNHQSWN